jgi:threonine/homoserine/homoserine lactone efflux protein
MSVHTWWLFVVVSFFVSATPGPNMLLVLSSSARHGFRASLGTMAGCLATLIAMFAVSAAGLGAVLQTFPALFDALRWAGAAYLAVLGIRCWRSPTAAPAEEVAGTVPLQGGAGALFRQGVLVAASNPKAILFAAAFLPQFIDPAQPKWPQFGLLLATFAVIEIGWYMVYAGSGRQLSAFLRRATVQRWFNRLTGGVFVGFAVAMAAARR